MIDLNKIAKSTLKNATKRMENGAHISTETRRMLKHTATEVVEATEAYTMYMRVCDEMDEDFVLDVKFHKEDFTQELADIICCVLIMAAKEDIDIEKAVFNAIEKNKLRAEGKGDKK